MSEYSKALEAIATDVVAKNAVEIDKSGAFPLAAMDALREAGLLGLISAKEVGGMGQGPSRGSCCRRAPGSGVRFHRDGGLHALRGQRRGGEVRRRGVPQRERRRQAPFDPGVLRGRIPFPLLGAREPSRGQGTMPSTSTLARAG